MATKTGVLSNAAWDSGIDYRAARHYPRRPHKQTIAAPQEIPAPAIPRTKRGAPPPLDDDVDLLGGLLLVTLFVLIVWL